MNAFNADFSGMSGKCQDKAQLRISTTHSGFNVTVLPRSKHDPAFWTEVAFKLVGILLLPAGGMALFLPEIVHGPAYIAAQIGMLAAFVFIGVAVHRRANRGFRRKIYVDSVRDEVRTGTVNLSGSFHLLAAYPTTNIESFFIVRSKDKVTPAKLKMRLKEGAQTISLLEGPETSLVKVLERMSHVLNPPKKNNRRFVTKRTGAFIRMTFG